MNMAKRVFSFFIAFALCAAMSLGSLSFMPKSFAVGDYEFPFSESDIPALADYPYKFAYARFADNRYYFYIIASKEEGQLIFSDAGLRVNSRSSDSPVRFTWDSVSSNWSTYYYPYTQTAVAYSASNLGSPFPYLNSIYNSSPSYLSKFSSPTFHYSFYTPPEPISSIPRYWDYSPFYFPEMPHGYFDGNVNVVDGTYNIDFPSNASIGGQITQTGNDHYTWTWNHGTLYWNGETVQGEHEGWISPDYQLQTPPIGDITQTAYANRLINLSLSDLDSVVNYTPAYNENSRFRCWSCLMDSSYVWFVSDTRNKITGSIVSVTSDEVTWKYEFADPQDGNTIYPTWAIVFSPMGEVIQVLSPSTVSNKNTYTLSCSIGTLEQDQDTGIWSCDPLYHGFWFSDDSPPVANITHLNVAVNKKYLANPVFGESAFQLQFLDSINRGIADINSNIQSLQSAMQSSISGQTSDFQNMDAPSAPQPSTSQMMDYFSKESAFSAPNTDEVFSGDIKSGHYWDGVTWWSTKFNDIIVSNQVIVAFTTAMLTLGLAVLIIGRRFSMR